VDGSEAHSHHHPHSAHILWVRHYLHAQRQLQLVSPSQQHLLSHLVVVYVVYHSFGVEMDELDRQGFEGVALWHVVLD